MNSLVFIFLPNSTARIFFGEPLTVLSLGPLRSSTSCAT